MRLAGKIEVVTAAASGLGMPEPSFARESAQIAVADVDAAGRSEWWVRSPGRATATAR